MQLLKRKLTFLYLPQDDSRVRQMHLSSGTFLLSVLGLVGVLVMAGFYLLGLWQGSSWLPGGSRLRQQNERLRGEIKSLEQRISVLRQDLVEVYQLQDALSEAVGLAPLDANVWQAGIGGRAPVDQLPGEFLSQAGSGRLAALQGQVAKLLRQARIQRQGYQAILDTLAVRQQARDHLPSIRPVDIGWLSSGFGKRPDPFTGKLTYHRGLDFSVPVGTPVRATADGIATYVGHESGFGRVVKLDHGNRTATLYAHLSKQLVAKGQRVRRGDIIAESGKSGRCTAPHLHYEVRLGGRCVNPLSYILDSYAMR
jgi:murein DD-endopeptidase MepM/ murein hydrolase activator NlpD